MPRKSTMRLKRVISASRRQDMVGTDPQGLADLLAANHPPEHTHTVVVWTKNPTLLIDHRGLRDVLATYDQVFVHLTITGMGATLLEPRVPPWQTACRQIPNVVDLTRDPRRVRLRFDPIVHVRLPDATSYTNLPLFRAIAAAASSAGVRDVTVSWMSSYRKVISRLGKAGVEPLDVDERMRVDETESLSRTAAELGVTLYGCCVPGWVRSACIDGRLLTDLHPRGEACSVTKAKGQRRLCGCTESLDIGWYSRCSHGCLYCYAQPADVPLHGVSLPV